MLLVAAAFGLAVVAFVESALGRRQDNSLKFMLCLLAGFVLLGFGRMGLQNIYATSPVLGEAFLADNFKGTITKIELRKPRIRLTLSDVEFESLAPSQTPKHIRISFVPPKNYPQAESSKTNSSQTDASQGNSPQADASQGNSPQTDTSQGNSTQAKPPLAISALTDFNVGDRIAGKGGFYPPARPAAAGLMDFSLRAWFKQTGAYGYALTPLRVIAKSPEAVPPLRQRILANILALEPNAQGGVIAALAVGVRGLIPKELMENIRISGLAHLLAISGLHLGLVMGGVFFVARGLMAAIPNLAIYHNIKMWAVFPAFGAGLFYLLLSGGAIPTVRSFLMVSLVLLAVLVERTAISMRSVAFAFIGILLVAPQSIMGAGFHLSFMATTALVWFYRHWKIQNPNQTQNLWHKLVLYFTALCLASLVAWLASMPFVVYHFHRPSIYSVAANLVAVPVTAFWVMPFIMLGLVTMPFGMAGGILGGIAGFFFKMAALGVKLILALASFVASLPFATLNLPKMPVPSLLLFVAGLVLLLVFRARLRWVGLCMALATGLYLSAPKPDLLVELDNLALKTEQGWLVTKKNRYWEPIVGKLATRKPKCTDPVCLYKADQRTIAVVKGKAECLKADVLITPKHIFKTQCRKAQVVIDMLDLWQLGTHSVFLEDLRVKTVRNAQGNRAWTRLTP